MELTIYWNDNLIATLRFAVEGGHWNLKAKTLHADSTPELEAAIKRAMLDATTDVFQPTGRVVMLNSVKYVAKPLRST